jgi:hypothetical protein
VKILGLDEPKAVLALALSPPRLDDIERTIVLLKEVSLLHLLLIIIIDHNFERHLNMEVIG